MTPAARYSAAIEVLDTWLAGCSIDKALAQWSRGARYAGSKDRAAVRDHVFDVLRQQGSCAALGGGADGRRLVLGLLRLGDIPPGEVFSGLGHAPAPLSPQEAKMPEVEPAPEHDFPAWLVSKFQAHWGHSAPDIMQALTRRAPVYLRVNRRKAARVDAQQMLAEDGIEVAPAQGNDALKVKGNARALRNARAYQEGVVELQDLSVQLACETINWPDAGRILDACAGGGGKSLAIAAHSKADLYAYDVAPKRMQDIAPRAARAGAAITMVHRPDAHAPYDIVLCDVPCSGSGTWRRDPEAKWRLTPRRLEELTCIQADILSDMQEFVKPGGRLVYMTCSLLAEENKALIAAFLASHPGWTCLSEHSFTPLTASDGFYVAELSKPNDS